MQTYFVVMLGGALGSALRLWLSSLLTVRYGDQFPIGTLVVNVLGCFVIGLFVAFAGPQGKMSVPSLAHYFVSIGILGGFTTFSSFGLQAFQLMVSGQWFRAGLYIVLSVVVCLLAVWAGHVLATAFQ